MIKDNHTARVREALELDKERLKKQADISEAQFYDLMLDSGTDFLKYIYLRDEPLQECYDVIIASEFYWKWWATQCKHMNQSFLVECDKYHNEVSKYNFNHFISIEIKKTSFYSQFEIQCANKVFKSI